MDWWSLANLKYGVVQYYGWHCDSWEKLHMIDQKKKIENGVEYGKTGNYIDHGKKIRKLSVASV